MSRKNVKTLQFLITGTQTGNLKTLSKHHYCTVLEAFTDKNSIKSEGEIKPSSEALTHASIYQQEKSIQAIIHIHCPKIWKNTSPLDLPHTSANIAYGTPEMAIEVGRLLKMYPLNTLVFSVCWDIKMVLSPFQTQWKKQPVH